MPTIFATSQPRSSTRWFANSSVRGHPQRPDEGGGSRRVYAYVSIGLKWDSRNTRHDLMDNTVDTTGLSPAAKMEDAQKYFEEASSRSANRARFEYLVMDPHGEPGAYGPNVFILKFDAGQPPLPEFAFRPVQAFYSRIEVYNDEYGDRFNTLRTTVWRRRRRTTGVRSDPKTAKETHRS